MKCSSKAPSRSSPARVTTAGPSPYPRTPSSLSLARSARTDTKTGRELRLIHDRLLARFGPQHWWPADSALEVIVGAVLTQNTAWSNVERAITNLRQKNLLSLSGLCAAGPARLARAIRPSGCYNSKARVLLNLARRIHIQGGISRLGRAPTPVLRSWLLDRPGIGPETADSVLLYAFDRPVFVVDAYTRRILYRYGLLQGDEGYAKVQGLFHRRLGRSSRLYNEFHALLVRLAKTHCRKTPSCTACPLA